MEITTRGEALKWWRMGISPIPLMLRSKRPMVKWKPWEDALPPFPMLGVWFKHHRNIGIVIRKGLCVLDFDTPIGYHLWKKEVNDKLRESYTVKTRRGWHVYLWMEERFPHIARMEKGGEVRGKGILVVPPSVHRSGSNYIVWIDAPICTVGSIDDIGVEWQMVTKERIEFVPYSQDSSDDSGIIARIKRAISVMTYLERLTKVEWNGSAWMCRCPFHNDRNPSMQVHPDDGWCYCHSPSCKAHKRCDVINIAELLWKKPMPDVIKILAQELD